MTSQQPIFRTSAEAVRLKRRLAEIPKGGTISYDEIRTIIGFDPQSDKGRGICATARKQIRHEMNAVFECVAKVGFKRLEDSEIVDLGSSIISGLRRKAVKGAHVLICPDSEKLTPAQRIQQMTAQTVCSVVAKATESRAVKGIAASVENSKRMLDYTEATLAAFK